MVSPLMQNILEATTVGEMNSLYTLSDQGMLKGIFVKQEGWSINMIDPPNSFLQTINLLMSADAMGRSFTFPVAGSVITIP